MSGPTELIRQNCPLATSNNDGLMSAAQAAAVAAGAAVTLQGAYDNGAGTPQTITEDAVRRGIKIVGSGQAGSIFAVQTSAAASALQVDEDGSVYLARAAGVKVQNTAAFGSPVIGSATPGGYMSYTADGVGGNWGGTGFTALAVGALSLVRITADDTAALYVLKDRAAISGFFGSTAASSLVITANAITFPLDVCTVFVGAGVLKTINHPRLTNVGFDSGWFYTIPTDAFTWDATGNIAVAGTAVVNRMIQWWYDENTTKFYPSYV